MKYLVPNLCLSLEDLFPRDVPGLLHRVRKAEWNLCLKWPAHNSPAFTSSAMGKQSKNKNKTQKTKLYIRCRQELSGALRTIYPACRLVLVAFLFSFFPLGTYCHPRWAIPVLQPAHGCHFFQISFFLDTGMLGRSCHFLNISSADSPTIPEACTFSSRWQARDRRVHPCSRSGATQCPQAAQEGLCLAVWVLQLTGGRQCPDLCSYCRTTQDFSEWRRGKKFTSFNDIPI